MRYRKVCLEAMGLQLPEQELLSADIETKLQALWQQHGLPPGYLAKLTGIKARRLWPVGTLPSKVAAQAGKQALVRADLKPAAVDLVIHTGVCRDATEPSTANVVHHSLGLAPHCQAFDLSNACLGFFNGIQVAANMIELGQAKTALIVSGENAGPIYQDTIAALQADPQTANLRDAIVGLTLGSAAVAAVLCHESVSREHHRILGGVAQTDSQSYQLCQGHGDCEHQSMTTDARGLMRAGLAISQVTWELCKRALGWDNATPQYVFTHQVSRSHQEKVFATLGLDPKKGFCDLEWLGNTGSVAMPLSLGMRMHAGHFRAGDQLALLGIGSGLNCMMLGVAW